MMRGGEVVTRLAHNQEINCANQFPATFQDTKFIYFKLLYNTVVSGYVI